MTTLRGRTVLLRPLRASDAPRQREFFKDAELAELDSSSPQGYAAIDVEAFIQARSAPDGEKAFFAIEVHAEYVGFAGLMNLRNSNSVFELGVNIGDRNHWNRGCGKEVVRLLLRYGFDQLDGREIELTTHQGNERAVACFSACGFSEKRRIHGATSFKGRQFDMIEMSIGRAEWKSRNSHSAAGAGR
jgi:RimJ/RimL family protein N-acetyltransferase